MRTNSYSTGIPYSKIGTVTFSRPALKAAPRISCFCWNDPFLANDSRDRFDPESFGGQRGIVAEQFDVVVQIDFDRAISL